MSLLRILLRPRTFLPALALGLVLGPLAPRAAQANVQRVEITFPDGALHVLEDRAVLTAFSVDFRGAAGLAPSVRARGGMQALAAPEERFGASQGHDPIEVFDRVRRERVWALSLQQGALFRPSARGFERVRGVTVTRGQGSYFPGARAYAALGTLRLSVDVRNRQGVLRGAGRILSRFAAMPVGESVLHVRPLFDWGGRDFLVVDLRTKRVHLGVGGAFGRLDGTRVDISGYVGTDDPRNGRPGMGRVLPTLLHPATDAQLRLPAEGEREAWMFTWTAVPGANAYQIEVTAPGIDRTVIRRRTDLTNIVQIIDHRFAPGAREKGWNWRVRALHANVPGVWTAWGAFSAKRAMLQGGVHPRLPDPSGPIVPIQPQPPTLRPDIRPLPPTIQPQPPVVRPQDDGPTLDPRHRPVPPTIDPNNLPTVPSLVAPAADSILPNANGGWLSWSFEWSGILGATRYRIQVRKAGASLMLVDQVVPGTDFRHHAEGYIVEANLRGWEWRVQALDANGPRGAFSAWRTFHVAPQR